MSTLVKYAALSIFSFVFPRFLVGVGVPLDKWAQALGAAVGVVMSAETALWGVATILAVALTGIEAWKRPLGHLWTRLAGGQLATATSSLKLSVGESGPYRTTRGEVYTTKRTYNVKLENTDRGQPITNGTLQIRSVAPETDYEGPWLLRAGITLAAGDHDFIPLVSYNEAREPEISDHSDTFIIMGTENGRPNLDTDKEYTVTLRATALETPFHDFQCRVWKDESGKLRIAEVVPRTTAQNVKPRHTRTVMAVIGAIVILLVGGIVLSNLRPIECTAQVETVNEGRVRAANFKNHWVLSRNIKIREPSPGLVGIRFEARSKSGADLKVFHVIRPSGTPSPLDSFGQLDPEGIYFYVHKPDAELRLVIAAHKPELVDITPHYRCE